MTHPLFELLLTAVTLLAQGWRDQDDVDQLRDDAVLRLAVSERKGVAPLFAPDEDGSSLPDGLASQPTLSRLMRTLSSEHNRGALRRALLDLAVAGLRLRPAPGIVLDVDSLPIEVHGHQKGSEYNGHSHARIYLRRLLAPDEG